MFCLLGKTLFAQYQDLSFSKPGNIYYQELTDPATAKLEEWVELENDISVSFADDNIRYAKESVPKVGLQEDWNVKAWKGEKVHTQILVWTKENIPDLSFRVNDLVNEMGDRITSENLKAAFVRFVMADEFGEGCSRRIAAEHDSSLVEDPIDIIDVIPVFPNTVQPIWLSIQVPGDIPPGYYTGTIIIEALHEYELKISLNVLNHVLPPAAEWEFDLDLWQYPAAIARIHNVGLWSDEHFELMKPYFTTLANAGQKVITVNIISQPWGNDHVHFDDPSLIGWIKKQDGSWEFEYNLFDKYISFVMNCGITQRINCYSMVTWDCFFKYYDEALGKDVTFKAEPVSREFDEYWTTMITDFTEHLKTKGWFGKTAIAFDERPMESILAVISILKRIDPEWKIALAGDRYHPELELEIYDYSIASYLPFSEDIISERKAQGMPTTYYTACKERHLGPYTFAPPAENAWIGWHAAEIGYTGYLFWAYNCWVKDPLRDSRYIKWPSGTCYQFYPGPRTSIRFEKLIEGIQDFEKIRILREQFVKNGEQKNIRKLNKTLSKFQIEKLENIPAADMLIKAKAVLNSF